VKLIPGAKGLNIGDNHRMTLPEKMAGQVASDKATAARD
jgi:hypothetical protein